MLPMGCEVLRVEAAPLFVINVPAGPTASIPKLKLTVLPACASFQE